jgi:hypothetical protein
MSRRLKKSESLEIRIPYPTKQAFMARCQAEGRTASEALRGFIEAHLEPVATPAPRRRSWRLIAGALLAAAVGAAAVPSLAHTSPQAAFDRLDADRDGRLSAAELSRLDTNRDGALSFAEYQAAR